MHPRPTTIASSRFDDEAYLFCLYEDREEIERLISQEDLWSGKETLDDRDLYDMANLPARKYLLDKRDKKQLLLGLLDILFAYAYDLRTNQGEQTPESNWTVAKLSPTLSWLDTCASLRDVVVTCYRRALIFPLFRYHGLSVAVMTDVVCLLRKGRKACLKSLLDIRRLFNQTLDSKYILNDLYITDYCVWMQKVKDKSLDKLASALEQTMVQVSKADLSLDLDLLEQAACLVIQEQRQQQESSPNAR